MFSVHRQVWYAQMFIASQRWYKNLIPTAIMYRNMSRNYVVSCTVVHIAVCILIHHCIILAIVTTFVLTLTINSCFQVDFLQMPVNTLRRYKRHYKLQTRPGLNKSQLAEVSP